MKPSSSNTKPPIPAKAIDRLFQRLSLNYGKHFAAMWQGIPQDEIKLEWADGLKAFSYQEIHAALEYCLDHNKFPPTLPEFKALCRDHRRPPVMQALPRHFSAEEMQRNRQRIAGICATLANGFKAKA